MAPAHSKRSITLDSRFNRAKHDRLRVHSCADSEPSPPIDLCSLSVLHRANHPGKEIHGKTRRILLWNNAL